jgi:hypothetical protein
MLPRTQLMTFKLYALTHANRRFHRTEWRRDGKSAISLIRPPEHLMFKAMLAMVRETLGFGPE